MLQNCSDRRDLARRLKRFCRIESSDIQLRTELTAIFTAYFFRCSRCRVAACARGSSSRERKQGLRDSAGCQTSI